MPCGSLSWLCSMMSEAECVRAVWACLQPVSLCVVVEQEFGMQTVTAFISHVRKTVMSSRFLTCMQEVVCACDAPAVRPPLVMRLLSDRRFPTASSG